LRRDPARRARRRQLNEGIHLAPAPVAAAVENASAKALPGIRW
jgi:hypothetical protein